MINLSLSNCIYEISEKVRNLGLHPCLPAGRDYKPITQIRNVLKIE